MRFRLPLGRTLFLVSAFILALIATIPMRLGLAWIDLDERGLAAREARGSVWNGALVEGQFGDAALGDLDAGLGFFPLLIGRARLGLDRKAGEGGQADEFSGAFTVSGADFGIDDMHARMAAADIFAPLPVTILYLEDVTAHFERGLCVEAEGVVRADLGSSIGGLSLPGTVSGNARCDESDLLLPMVGQSGVEQLNLRIAADGSYALELLMTAVDDAMRDRLTSAGFAPGPRGYAMTVNGEL